MREKVNIKNFKYVNIIGTLVILYIIMFFKGYIDVNYISKILYLKDLKLGGKIFENLVLYKGATTNYFKSENEENRLKQKSENHFFDLYTFIYFCNVIIQNSYNTWYVNDTLLCIAVVEFLFFAIILVENIHNRCRKKYLNTCDKYCYSWA